MSEPVRLTRIPTLKTVTDFRAYVGRFDAGREMPAGLNIELSITWPVMLHKVAPLQLVAAGRIVRCNSPRVAIQMTTHEFRTVATVADQQMLEARPKILKVR